MNTIAQQQAISRAAGRWARYARAQGARFDVERKAAAASVFSILHGGTSFALPSRLVGTRRHQHVLARLARAGGWPRLHLHAGAGTVTAVWHGDAVGRLQAKHVCWLRPLLPTGRLACHVLQVTGGTAGAPTRGCNIVLCGIGAAVEAGSGAGTLPGREGLPGIDTAVSTR